MPYWALVAVTLAITVCNYFRSRAIINRLRYDGRTGALVDTEFRRLGQRRLRAGGALAVLDLNGLKSVNDGEGHAAGDLLLAGVATWIQSNIDPSDLFGRIGGDEFGLLTEHQASLRELQEALKLPLSIEGRSVGVACGVVEVEPEVDLDELIVRADREMYVDKRIKKSMRTSGKAA